jgi:hypothetical protein
LEKEMKRRLLLAVLSVALLTPFAAAGGPPLVEVWKSESCGCCDAWVKHLQRNGLATKVHHVDDPGPIRRALCMPAGSPGMDIPDAPPYEVYLVRITPESLPIRCR